MTELKETINVIIDGDEQAVVHIREVMAEFQCHKVVMAAKITEIDESNGNCDTSMELTLPDTDISMTYIAPLEVIARYMPVVGDYVVLYENDYVSISPKQAFEDGYSQIQFTNLGDELNIPTENMDQITAIAKMCHEVLSAYCLALREEQTLWSELSDEARDKIIGRVAFIILNPDAKAQANHDVWMLKMLSNGWTYGKANDTAKKKHSSLVPFHHLPTEQQAKDHIFNAIVRQAIDS
jgi:hypothetical protein